MVSLLPATSSIALKEWAIICNALKDGEQIVLLRKGGIRSEDRNFTTEFNNYPEFLLFPTYEHQSHELIKPNFHDHLEKSIEEDDVPGLTTLSAFAQVTDHLQVDDPHSLRLISDFHIWTDEYVSKRINWRPRQLLTIALLRVYPLVQPQALPVLEEYSGCKSWVDLGQDVPMGALVPALSDPDYEEIRSEIKTALAAHAIDSG